VQPCAATDNDKIKAAERLFARRVPHHLDQREKLVLRRLLSLDGLEEPVPHPRDREFESFQGKCLTAFKVSINPGRGVVPVRQTDK
jgi:hypothetical protein